MKTLVLLIYFFKLCNQNHLSFKPKLRQMKNSSSKIGKKFCLLIFLFFSTFYSCQKEYLENNDLSKKESVAVTDFIAKAQATLKSKMSIEDFNSLDWNNLPTKKITTKTPVLKIPSKFEKGKYLYYSVCNNNEVYNWVRFNVTTEKGFVSGTITLIGVDNVELNVLTINKNKLQSSLRNQSPATNSTTTFGPSITLDQVIVIGYIVHTEIDFGSLYWFFNQSSYFIGWYTDFDLSLYSNGSGNSTPIPDINPVRLVTVDSVVNTVTDTCMNNAFLKLTANNLKNVLNKLYQQTFVGINNVHNLSIEPAGSIPNPVTGNQLPARSFRDIVNTNTWVIELNTGFSGQFTQELWGSIILHELIHGFIQKNDLDFNSYSTFSNTHEEMLSNWVLQMQQSLMEAFGISPENALALSLEGFDDVLKDEVSNTFKADWKAWVQQNYVIDLTTAQQIADGYYTGVKGTKCQ